MKILILEDDEPIGVVLKEFICDGLKDRFCDFFRRVEEAEAALRSTQYDMVIADLMIRGTPCLDFLDHVKELQPHAKLYLMSAWPKSKEIAEAHNVDCFVAKPFDLEIISEIFSVPE